MRDEHEVPVAELKRRLRAFAAVGNAHVSRGAGLALAELDEIAESEEVVVSCEHCCDDDQWEGWGWLRWFICGPLGWNCPCAPDDPPEEEGE